METNTADIAWKSGIRKGKLWKFLMRQKREFKRIRPGFKAMGQKFKGIGLESTATENRKAIIEKSNCINSYVESSLEANSPSDIHEVRCVLWNYTFHFSVYNIPH
jgi:hypothetical protein